MVKNDVVLTFKLSAQDKELLSAIAVHDDRTMSSEIRILIRQQAERLGIKSSTK